MIQAASLFVVLLAARVLTIVGHEAGFVSGVPPIVHGVLEDAAIAASLALLDAVLRRPRFTWIVYAALAALAAFDVPVSRTLGTPMTPVMLRGARVALADSILTHATLDAVLRLFGVVTIALATPFLLIRLRADWAWRGRGADLVASSGALALVSLLALATPGTATPLHRNCVVALTAPLLRAASPATSSDRQSTAAVSDDLSSLRATARGANVLFVVLESTGARPLGLYGAEGHDPMPRLSTLAASGLVFDAAYSTFPESIRSQVAYWDSRHPPVGRPPAELAIPLATPLPRLLRDAGYRTALVHSGHFDYLGMDHVVTGRGFDVREDAGDLGGTSATSFGVDEETAVARVLGWIDEGPSDVPWFAAYLPIAGHHPYDTPRPGPFSGATAASQYRNALRYADESLGLLLDGLAARGVLGHTLIVVTGDHGEAFGEHPGNHGHTFQLYEENVHVPLVIVPPTVVALGHAVRCRVADVASHVDLAPTIADFLGLPSPAGWEGVSLLATTPQSALFVTDWAERLVGLRDGRFKFVLSLDSDEVQLYDLVVDPHEQTNLAEDDARVAAYRARFLPER